jgi:hypothetical protein
MPPMQHYQQLNYAKIGMITPKPVPYKRIKLSSSASKSDQSLEQSQGNKSVKITKQNCFSIFFYHLF